jgi:hypothetical protein
MVGELRLARGRMVPSVRSLEAMGALLDAAFMQGMECSEVRSKKEVELCGLTHRLSKQTQHPHDPLDEARKGRSGNCGDG